MIGIWMWSTVSMPGSSSGRYAKSMVDVSPTVLSDRLVLKCRTTLGASADSVVGRFDCSMAVLKARELTSSWALRRDMSWHALD